MMGKKVVGYIRVSTEGQVRDGYSLAYQVEEIERYCNENNLELLRVYEDRGLSGATVDEEGLTVERDGLVQAHHAIQDEWAKIWAKTSGNKYSSRQAPSILIKSTSDEPHAIISALQRARRRNEGFSTDIIYEFNISYKEMIEAGVDFKVAKKVMREANRYFDGLGGFK
ncbi:recombinase family protein [Bacillus paramycoides]|uniref:recombinase family protein n=1 Tax=Bacillus paramycoides TaxID=2026194 RepID=UPI002E24F6F0|nr:recombinase family protein [Bacillus paramycoides]MED1559372.1 recombinase family protein [Bacillus paramycoides]